MYSVTKDAEKCERKGGSETRGRKKGKREERGKRKRGVEMGLRTDKRFAHREI